MSGHWDAYHVIGLTMVLISSVTMVCAMLVLYMLWGH